MKLIQRLALWAAVACAAMLVVTVAPAQETSSALRVNVLDNAGTAVANVSVDVTHVPSGTTRTFTTNESGVVLARGLKVGGPYVVKIAEGAKYTAKSADNLFLNLGATESVTLTANSAVTLDAVTVTGAGLSQQMRLGSEESFSSADIDAVASVSRDIKSVLQTDPKISVDLTEDGGPSLSIAGANIRFNSLTVDGIAQNDNFGLNKNGYPGRRSPISLDAIEQIQVNITPYDVTYGNFLGGNVNVVTKSGTNEFHGSAFGYYSDESLTGSRSEGVDLGVANFEDKTWGATLGGPIIKDKLFFFGSYEKYDTTRGANRTIDGIAGVTQQDVDRVRTAAKSLYGFETGDFGADISERDEKILAKLDWNINDYHRMVGTYQRSEGNSVRDFLTDQFNEAGLESSRYNQTERVKSVSYQMFSDWTENFSTEVKLGFKDVTTKQISLSPDFPAMQISTGSNNIDIGGDIFRHANDLANKTRFIKLKGDYFVGDHTFTVGYEQEKTDIFNLFVFASKGQYIFNSVADFEAQKPFAILYQNAVTGNPMDAAADFTFTTHTVYAQDKWTPTSDLTITAGVRYDEIENNDLPALNSTVAGRIGFSNQFNFDGVNLISPRIGFNYTVDDRTTVRGGAGIFGGGTPAVWLSNSYANTGVLTSLAFIPDAAVGGAVANSLHGTVNADTARQNFQSFVSTADPAGQVNAIDPDFKMISSYKTNLALDRKMDLSFLGLGDDWNFTVEGIWTFVKDGIAYRDGRRHQTGTAPDGRPIYSFENGFDLILTNTGKGHSSVYTINVDKSWDGRWGRLNAALGYTYQDAKEVNPGNSFIAFEGYGAPATADPQAQRQFNSEFEVKDRVTANLTWEKAIFGSNMTRVNLFYSGRSGRHFSYVFDDTSAFGGAFLADFGNAANSSHQLLYVPTGINDPLITGPGAAALVDFVNHDDCLSRFKGRAVDRHACSTGWTNRVDLRISQEAKLFGDHSIEFFLDVENLGNLINSDWGRQASYLQPFNTVVAVLDGNNPFVNGAFNIAQVRNPQQVIAQIPSVYKIQLGFRYKF